MAINDDQDQLPRISLSARDHPTRDLAVVRFTLSFRDIEDRLAERGIVVSMRRCAEGKRGDRLFFGVETKPVIGY